jgi:Flp pilus assembly protein TadD
MHDDQRALTSAQHAAARLPVSEATYQADIIAALAFQRLKRPDDAGRAFAAALDVVPGGQSATLGLSTLLALSGHGSQADQLITRSLAQHPSDDDPWRRFPYGDYVHWNAIVRDLHKTIR